MLNIKPKIYIIIIITIFCFVNLIGLLPLPIFNNNDEVSFYSNYLAFLLGIIGLIIPLFFKFNPKKVSNIKYKTKYIYKSKGLFTFFCMSLLISLMAIFYVNISAGGIVLFHDSDRYTKSSFLTIIGYISIAVTLITYTSNKIYNFNKGVIINILIVIYLISLITLGYRSPIIILLGSIITINTFMSKKKIFNKRNIIIGIIGVVLMSLIGGYRIQQNYQMDTYYKAIDFNYVGQHKYVIPIIPAVSLFRFDQTVVSSIIKNTSTDYSYGGLALSNFLTVLPGAQLGARNIIGKIIGARSKPGTDVAWSITPTLQGALYVDGGFLLIFLGFFFASFSIHFLFKKMYLRPTPGSIAVSAFVFVNVVMSLHTGYLDVSFFIVFFIMYLIDLLIIKKIRI